MKKAGKILLALFLILCAIGGCAAYLARQRYFVVDFAATEYVESSRRLSNPYRGWYRIYGYRLSDAEPPDMDEVKKAAAEYTAELVLLEINLRDYAAGDISETALLQLNELFSVWHDAGRQLIVRFLYDWDGKAKETEPSDISVILRHMEQTALYVNRYKDCIWLMQGIYIGNCGEMNNSEYMSTEHMLTLANRLAELIDPAIFLAVRTPAHRRTICQSFDVPNETNAFDGSLLSRIALFNDGMLGSGNDLGTYGDAVLAQTTDYTAKGTREEELDYQNALCNYVPNGGEVVLNDVRSDFHNAMENLARMRVSYLDYDYDRTVLEKWHGTTYTVPDCFYNSNGYDYIGEHLGYRYFLSAAHCEFDWLSEDGILLYLHLINRGYSGSYHTFPCTVTLVSRDTGMRYEVPLSFDTRFLGGGDETELTVKLPGLTKDILSTFGFSGDTGTEQTLTVGRYEIWFSMKDATTERQIHLANTVRYSEELGYFLGTLDISK